MSNRITPIDGAILQKEVADHIAKASALHKLSIAMRAYMEALNKKPRKPTSRMKAHLQEFLYSFLGEPINLFYDSEKTWNDKCRVKITIRNYVDEEIRYQLEFNEQYVIDVEQSMMGHALWGETVNGLTERLEALPQKVAEFNTALATLTAISQFAKPATSIFPLYPLSQHFHWYELPHK